MENSNAARAETARLRALLDEIRDAVKAAGKAEDKVRWLIDRLKV
jgi:hypothetical protein